MEYAFMYMHTYTHPYNTAFVGKKTNDDEVSEQEN
jgi:hypothetical protein